MNIDLKMTNAKQHLHKRDVIRIKLAQSGMAVSCQNGVLWVTLSGDHRDYLLTAGQSLVLDQNRQAYLEALRDVDFKITPPDNSRLN